MHSSEKGETAVLTRVIIIIIAKINKIGSKSKILIQGSDLSAFIKIDDKGSKKTSTEMWG